MRGCRGVAGVDEAGRGPLAGPVVAAAVILPAGFDTRGIADSKTLGPTDREEQAWRIRQGAAWSIGIVGVHGIDTLNILWATMRAMEIAIAGLPHPPDWVLVDGNRLPAGVTRGEALVDGDDSEPCISAASIIAKTIRDRIMRRYGEVYPQYGFERHFGYSTPAHLAALREHGPCPIHRQSFAPVRGTPEQLCLAFDE